MRFISPWERRVLERGHKQGLEKGLEKGRQEGIQKGRQEEAIKSRLQTLEMILRKRFGRIPIKIRQQMKGGHTEMLKTWIDRSLDAANIEDVFN